MYIFSVSVIVLSDEKVVGRLQGNESRTTKIIQVVTIKPNNSLYDNTPPTRGPLVGHNHSGAL